MLQEQRGGTFTSESVAGTLSSDRVEGHAKANERFVLVQALVRTGREHVSRLPGSPDGDQYAYASINKLPIVIILCNIRADTPRRRLSQALAHPRRPCVKERAMLPQSK